MARRTWSGMALWWCLVLPLLAAPAAAQPASLVRDVDPRALSNDSTVSELLAVGSWIFFTTSDRYGDPQNLWVTDGTGSGAERLLDDCAGQCNPSPYLVRGMGGLLYLFARTTGGGNFQLWRSDGTRRGTFALTGSFEALGFVPFGQAALFLNCTALDACALWRTDGSAAGTRAVGGLSLAPSALVAFGGKVHYLGYRDRSAELWASDGTAAGTRRTARPAAALVSARTDPAAATGDCAATPGRLCLQGGRFAVTAAWKDFQGRTGTAVPLTADTGTFWFFDPANVEVVTKVVDGRAVNQRFWLFYGALSSVEYSLTVTDTQTGAVKTYRNPSGNLASVADTGAF